jgi:predicted dinucleotide-utilizing enzyme
MMSKAARRIGIVGYGKLGQHLCRAIQNEPSLCHRFKLAFVWNLYVDEIGDEIPAELRLAELREFASYEPDLIVEVAHPCITWEYGTRFLAVADYMAASATAYAHGDTESQMRAAACLPNGHGLYVPRGALPGLEEVLRMAAAGKLGGARVAMTKHPASLNYLGELEPPMAETTGLREIYRGPLRELCGLAPNNVNTMAVLAMASELGFDAIEARLVADPSLEHHITEVVLLGPETGGPRYSLELCRSSPAAVGAVSSSATLDTFLSSTIAAHGCGDGVHYC